MHTDTYENSLSPERERRSHDVLKASIITHECALIENHVKYRAEYTGVLTKCLYLKSPVMPTVNSSSEFDTGLPTPNLPRCLSTSLLSRSVLVKNFVTWSVLSLTIQIIKFYKSWDQINGLQSAALRIVVHLSPHVYAQRLQIAAYRA